MDILRHVQLKSMVKGGKKSKVSVNLRLASKPAGCVVWFDYDPATLRLGPFRWFGTLPGLGLPDAGEKVTKHSKGDAIGTKGERVGHRDLSKSKFTTVDSMADLVPMLFGHDPDDEIQLLRHAMGEPPDPIAPDWVREVHAGDFGAIPDDLGWEGSIHLAHLVDGYELTKALGLGNPFALEDRQLAHATETGRWAGGPATLWATLFLEHRRWRMASPFTPGPDAELLLDRLCCQLAGQLKSALQATP